jgi:sucrose-6-phosphate hydrolase SacC (GH32 family)
MEREIKITEDYLYIPIRTGKEEKLLEIFCEEEEASVKIAEFSVPVDTAGGEDTPDYFARVSVEMFKNQKLTLKGDVKEAFLNQIKNDGYIEDEPQRRPALHFTATRGWINDPNGLVYSKGVYHLYFQYNPFDTKWNNMCWGHAVSKDLLHWKQEDTVLFPDKDGMMFSGSGLVNERGMLGLPKDALLFFYTVSGGNTSWSSGKAFTQKIAYSLDDGKTLIKTKKGMLATICQENRDPKVFWHEESQAYIMCLWLEKSDYAIFRSTNLEQWEQSHRFTLQDAWECPDLIKVKTETGKYQWVFWTADGFYYFGTFDGYRFVTDCFQHNAYLNTLPYAAQTYAGVGDRAISISWLKTKQEGRLYRGTMALPRELSIVERNRKQYLSQRLLPEMETIREQIYFKEGIQLDMLSPLQIDIILKASWKEKCDFCICGTRFGYDPTTGDLIIGQETWRIDTGILDFSFVIDDDILEVAINQGMLVGVFERKNDLYQLKVDPIAYDKMNIFRLK